MWMSIDEIEQWEKKNKTVKVPEEKWLLAQETMRKYEKILDIIHCYNRYTDDAAECIENLREVVEDGNDRNN